MPTQSRQLRLSYPAPLPQQPFYAAASGLVLPHHTPHPAPQLHPARPCPQPPSSRVSHPARTPCATPPWPQVATDTRLWLYGQLQLIRAALRELIAAAADRAEAEADVLMPGFTHLQPAMTVRWSHWLLSHAAAWQRDDERLEDLMLRVARLPLGSGEAPPRCCCRRAAVELCCCHINAVLLGYCCRRYLSAVLCWACLPRRGSCFPARLVVGAIGGGLGR
jgi:hypothetical protein